jgi:hypothetical protein
MKWITRERVKVDCVACPWLIKHFIDREADFEFLPAGHGEVASFDSILKKYRLGDPALRLLADIVRAAGSHSSNPHPAGEGLRWIASGFNALELTDQEVLELEFVVYDALYAECRRRIAVPLLRIPVLRGADW